MDSLVTIAAIIGMIAVIVFFRTWRNRTAAAPSAPAETSRQTLYRLAGGIENFVERSAHPRELYDQEDFLAAAAILSGKDVPFDLLRQYVTGASWPLACVALHVLAQRAERDSLCQAVVAQLKNMRPWTIYFALRYLNSLEQRPPVGAPVAQAEYWWHENIIIPDAFREYFNRRVELGDAASFGSSLEEPGCAEKKCIEDLLRVVDHPSSAALREEMKHWSELHLDRAFLSTVGRFWAHEPPDDLLIVPDGWRDKLAEACAAILKSDPHRSVLVSGEARVGKTSFLKLVSHLLEDEGWSVFEASAAELMAGQMYIGQLEERIRRVVTELDAAKKVVWYVPDLLQIATSGQHQSQSASILDQASQALNAGKIVLISETSPAGLVKLLQTRPSLRGVFELLRFQPMNEAETAVLVGKVAAKVEQAAGLDVTGEAIDTVLHVSHQYLGSTQLPGVTIDLLKRSANHAMTGGRKAVGPEDVIETLSQLSGLPRLILDDGQRLDLGVVREHFKQRVIGQAEAVGAIVDRIAMLKAGLVDPQRPIGVFLFAGPTGTGKTELAKTLAAYLFGSADRMARLDMSELQTAESTTKILGTGSNETDSLAEKVRKQPFSVVLLDEFEKAHSNAWDLFLQVFDDGRLTDAMGRTVDFRHTIIILTTNLGATAHAADMIGFARRQSAYNENQILTAVGRTFRPEFVNRLDRIIVFRPLSRDYMRQILEKELGAVLERRGLRQRDWAVEYEDSAIGFLLDKGFTADMGARPLRRAIDEHLLAPLAATVVEHRYPAGDQFLFVKSDGSGIQVEFVDPDAEDVPPAAAVPEGGSGALLARAMLGASGSLAEYDALKDAATAIDARLNAPEWRGLHASLAEVIGEPGIWQRKDRAGVFSRYELMSRVLEARRTADRLQARLEASRIKQGKGSRELAARLALQLHVVRHGIDDALFDAPIDVLVRVEPVIPAGGADGAATAKWCSRLTAMYREWGRRRHMRLREVAAPAQPPIFEITGFGAFRVLGGEAGLHVWEDADGTRIVARVRVGAGPDEGTSYQALERALEAARDGTAIVRRYRKEPDMLVRDAHVGWRSGKLDAVLAGDFDLIGLLNE